MHAENSRYQTYLRSEEWAAKRKAALEYAEHRCQVCYGDRGQLHTHHRTYARLYDERPADLVILCAHCHKLFHGKVMKRSADAFSKWQKAHEGLRVAIDTNPRFVDVHFRDACHRLAVVRTRCNAEQTSYAEAEHEALTAGNEECDQERRRQAEAVSRSSTGRALLDELAKRAV